MNFKIVPISKEYAMKIRVAGRDDFGNELEEQIAGGYGPCRVSLKPFVPGVDRRILAGHSPFEIPNAFNQPGPIFFNASSGVDEYSDVNRFPAEIKADKTNFPLTLIGYSSDQRMVFAELVGDRDVDEMIDAFSKSGATSTSYTPETPRPDVFFCKIERI